MTSPRAAGMAADDPRHGSNAGFLAHARHGQPPCDPCKVARRVAQKRRRVNRERNMPNRLPLGTVAWQIVVDTPRNQLYKATGIRGVKLSALEKNGPDQIVNRSTRDRILAAIGTPFWTPIGIQRRVQALQAIGYSVRRIADEMGDAYAVNLTKLNQRDEVHFVREAFAERIIAAYDRLHMKPISGTASTTRARNLAARNQWPPPLAWNDIDDVDERPNHRIREIAAPDPIAIERALDGDFSLNLSRAERYEVVRRWAGFDNELERRTGWNVARMRRDMNTAEEVA